jgi:hypothetical protein
MTPQEEIFARQIESVLHSLRALLQRASGSSDPQAVVAEAMQIISSSLEELSAVAENLRRARDRLELSGRLNCLKPTKPCATRPTCSPTCTMPL